MTVAQVQLGVGVALSEGEVLAVAEAQVVAEAIALASDGLDSNHRRNGSVVQCTGIGDDFHALNLLRTELLQFILVLHLPPIDIYYRCSFAQHFEFFTLGCHARHLCQHLLCCSRLSEDGSMNGGHHRVAGKLGLRHLSLHDNLAQHRLVFLHLNSSHVGIIDIDVTCMIADVGQSEDATLHRALDEETTFVIGCSSLDVNGVCR